MPIQNPAQLAEELKRSGEFDRLRRELLEEFRNGEGLAPFVSRVEDIVRKKLHYDSKLLFGLEATAQRELAQELDRYPVVERAVSDIPSVASGEFSSRLHESLSRVLQESRSGDTAAASEPADVEMSDRATLPQLQIPVLNGRATSKNQTGAQQGNDSDSDSAMDESPVSKRGGEAMFEVNYQVNGAQSTVPQIAEHPAPDSPAEDTPIPNHLEVDTPMLDASAVDTPMVHSPAFESSAINTPVVNSPADNSTEASSPALNSTGVDSPALNSTEAISAADNSPIHMVSTPVIGLPIDSAPTVDPSTHTPTGDPLADHTPAVDSAAVNSPMASSVVLSPDPELTTSNLDVHADVPEPLQAPDIPGDIPT